MAESTTSLASSLHPWSSSISIVVNSLHEENEATADEHRDETEVTLTEIRQQLDALTTLIKSGARR